METNWRRGAELSPVTSLWKILQVMFDALWGSNQKRAVFTKLESYPLSRPRRRAAL